MNAISLTMGDWSHDGHNKTKTVTISCNLDRDALEEAYEAGVKKTDVDLEEIAADYEDNEFPQGVIDILRGFGFIPEEFLGKSWRDESVWIVDTDGFWRIWLFIAKVGNPELEFEQCEATINIGGYGMFHS